MERANRSAKLLYDRIAEKPAQRHVLAKFEVHPSFHSRSEIAEFFFRSADGACSVRQSCAVTGRCVRSSDVRCEIPKNAILRQRAGSTWQRIMNVATPPTRNFASLTKSDVGFGELEVLMEKVAEAQENGERGRGSSQVVRAIPIVRW